MTAGGEECSAGTDYSSATENDCWKKVGVGERVGCGIGGTGHGLSQGGIWEERTALWPLQWEPCLVIRRAHIKRLSC